MNEHTRIGDLHLVRPHDPRFTRVDSKFNTTITPHRISHLDRTTVSSMFLENPEPAWFCLKSRPKHEHIASAHLRQMPDVEVFGPRIRLQRSTVRGLKWFEESMFPGYLFARFSFIERHKEVRYAMGISAILSFGGRYASLDDAVIEGLRSKTDSQQVATVTSEVNAGDSVKIVGGALRGLEGVVTHLLSGKERVRVLLTFLGREIQAEVGKFGVLPPQRHPLAA